MMTMYSGIVAVIMAFSMAFTSIPQGNRNGDLYERAQCLYTNVDATVSISADSSIEEETLEILDEIIIAEESAYDSSSPVSLKSILTSIFDSDVIMNAAYNMSSDGKSGNLKFDLDSNLALTLNEQLDFTAGIGFSLWADYDFTSLENFKCEIIMLTPADTRYKLFDLALLLTEEEKASILDGTFLGDGMLEIDAPVIDTASALDLLRKNSTITVDEKNHGRIVMTNENMKNYILDVLSISMQSVTESLPDISTGIQPIEETLAISFMQPIKDFISTLDLFDEQKALVCDYYFDDGNNLTGSCEVINFSFNMKEIWSKFGEFENMMYASMYPDLPSADLTVPPADFEITGETEDPWHKLPEVRDDFIFSLKVDTKYNKYGEAVDIQKPELTELNTIDVYEQTVSEELLYPSYDNYPSPTYAFVYEYGNAYWRDEITIPLRGFIEDLCYGSEEITYDNGVITVKSNGETDLFETISLTVGSNTVIKDGETFALSKPIYTLDGSTRLTEEFFAVLWNGEIDYIEVSTINRDENGNFYYETRYDIYIPEQNPLPF